MRELRLPNLTDMNYELAIELMEDAVVRELSKIEVDYAIRKWVISERTGIPEDVLTVILKRLKYAGKVELMQFFNEENGLVAGSGYCLTDEHRKTLSK